MSCSPHLSLSVLGLLGGVHTVQLAEPKSATLSQGQARQKVKGKFASSKEPLGQPSDRREAGSTECDCLRVRLDLSDARKIRRCSCDNAQPGHTRLHA
jgi:hypothetical protein